MALYATIKSFEPAPFAPLMYALNVNEAEYMARVLSESPKSDKGIYDTPLRVNYSHRGYELHLENDAVIYRSHPTTPGGNGYVSDPIESEKCMVYYKDVWYNAMVDFSRNEYS